MSLNFTSFWENTKVFLMSTCLTYSKSIMHWSWNYLVPVCMNSWKNVGTNLPFTLFFKLQFNWKIRLSTSIQKNLIHCDISPKNILVGRYSTKKNHLRSWFCLSKRRTHSVQEIFRNRTQLQCPWWLTVKRQFLALFQFTK